VRIVLKNILMLVLFIGIAGQNVFAGDALAVVSGTIKFEGADIPPPEMMKTNEDIEFCGGFVETERLIVQPENKGIKNVIVGLTAKEAHAHPSGKENLPTVEIKSEKCRFTPHVIVVPAGTVLNLVNDDPVLHGFHFFSGDKGLFNVALTPRKKAQGKKPLNSPGLVEAKCDIHDFMRGFIMVMETPYFALTDGNGAFTVADVPPGKYLLTVMHESFRLKDQEIELKPGEKKNLSLGVNDK